MPATQQQIQEFNKYRLFEQNPVAFVKSNSAETILAEFNKVIQPIDYDKDPYRFIPEDKVTDARKLDIISTMLETFGNKTNAKNIVSNRLTPQFWKE